MDQNELIAELLQGLTDDMTKLKAKVAQLPSQQLADPTPRLDAMGKSLAAIYHLLKQPPVTLVPAVVAAAEVARPVPPPPVDLGPVLAQVDSLKQEIRQRPEYRMSRYIQYGLYSFGLMVILLVVMSWLALDWKGERDMYQQAYERTDWRVRYTQQANPAYYNLMEGIFHKDKGIYQWVVDQEQADRTRALAQQAADQAKALSNKANQLERKATEGKKKAAVKR